MQNSSLKWLIPILLCAIIIPFQSYKRGYQIPIYDARGYASEAGTLAIFPSDEYVKAHQDGIVFPPMYPLFLKTVASFSDAAKDSLACYAKGLKTCELDDLAPVFDSQIILMTGTLFLIFLSMYFLSGSFNISIFGLLLVLFLGKLNIYAVWLITETVAFFFFFIFIAAFAYVVSRPSRGLAYFIMGLGLAGASLTRPSYLYLCYFLVLTLPFYLLFFKKETVAGALKNTSFLVVTLVLFIGPWIFRNYYYFDVANVSAGYGSFILAERVSYNLMTWGEYIASFIYWLPDFGDTLAAALFPHSQYARLEFDTPDGFYLYGNTVFRQEIYAMADTEAARMSLLLKDYVLADLFKHVMVTFTMVFRGMWVAKYFGLVGAALSIPAFLILKRSVGGWPIFYFILPFFFMLGLNAFVSVSIPRYNMPMVCIFGLAGAVVFTHLWTWIKSKKE